MACYHPLTGYVVGINHDTGKRIIKIGSCEYDGIDLPDNFQFRHDAAQYSSAMPHEKILIPCGRCIGCRLKYSRIWADRMMAESLYHESNVFLTLTYDNDNLPDQHEYVDKETGEIKVSPVHSINKRDVQLFIKRLRKQYSDQKIRYYAAGEYGEKSLRPHYHLIIFGLKIPDMKLLRESDQGFTYFVSDTISKLWPYGFHLITNVTWETCAYVARYVMKKQKGNTASIYEEYGFEPEFALMSRKPGIGRSFYDEHKKELLEKDGVYYPTDNGAVLLRSNSYYDRLLDIDYPEEAAEAKEKRVSLAKDYNKVKSNMTSLEYNDLLYASELNKNEQVKSLKRKEV